MSDVLFLPEDVAQEKFVGRLALRMAAEEGVRIRLLTGSAIRGVSGVHQELKFLQVACSRGARLPDAILIAIDANCHGLSKCRSEVDAKAPGCADRIIHAIADPHIERWFLLDGQAFKYVLGQGCPAPDRKREQDRYKQQLRKAILDTGVRPLLGGLEYAEELADRVDLRRVARLDPGLRDFIDEWRSYLRRLR